MTGLSHLSRFKIPSHITNCPGQFIYVKKKQRYFNCSFERESNGQNSLTWKNFIFPDFCPRYGNPVLSPNQSQ